METDNYKMKKGITGSLPLMPSLMAIVLSAVMIMGTIGTAITGVSIPHEQRVFAQEVCEWYDPTCVGDYVGDDDEAVISPPAAETGAPAPAPEACNWYDPTCVGEYVGDDDAVTSSSGNGSTPISTTESKYCDPNQETGCLGTDYIYDTSSGTIVCDGTQYDCSAYIYGFDIEYEDETGATGNGSNVDELPVTSEDDTDFLSAVEDEITGLAGNGSNPFTVGLLKDQVDSLGTTGESTDTSSAAADEFYHCQQPGQNWMLTSIGGAEVGKFVLGGTALWFTLRNEDTNCYVTLRFIGGGLAAGVPSPVEFSIDAGQSEHFKTYTYVTFDDFDGWGGLGQVQAGANAGYSLACASLPVKTTPWCIDTGGLFFGTPTLGGGLYGGSFDVTSEPDLGKACNPISPGCSPRG